MNAINIIPYIEAIIAILSLINSKTRSQKYTGRIDSNERTDVTT